jgi:hypothetical protein
MEHTPKRSLQVLNLIFNLSIEQVLISSESLSLLVVELMMNLTNYEAEAL